jgi:hypothetical protein
MHTKFFKAPFPLNPMPSLFDVIDIKIINISQIFAYRHRIIQAFVYSSETITPFTITDDIFFFGILIQKQLHLSN